MTKDDLARAVVRLPGFVPAVGLRFADGWTVTRVWGGDGEPVTCNVIVDDAPWEAPDTDNWAPATWLMEEVDLDDPATGGVLLEMVPPEERWRVVWLRRALCWGWLTNPEGGVMDITPCDSLGHAAAAVLVDCGRCHSRS